MSVAFRSAGAWATVTVTGTIGSGAMPAGTQDGDRLITIVTYKDYSTTCTIATAGWTEFATFADGAVASGNGTGSMRIKAWYADQSGGSAPATPDITVGATIIGGAVCLAFSKDSGEAWSTPLVRTAAWPSQSTGNVNHTANGTVDVPSGGAVMCVIGIRDDSATFTRPTNAIGDESTTMTWNGNYVESPATHLTTTTGNDMAADAGYRLVTTGAAAETLFTTITALTAAETGSIMWIVLNDEIPVAAEPFPYTGGGYYG